MAARWPKAVPRSSLANPRPGWFEQEVDDWWTSCATALRQVTAADRSVAHCRPCHFQPARDLRAVRRATTGPCARARTWLDERAAAAGRGAQRRTGRRQASSHFRQAAGHDALHLSLPLVSASHAGSSGRSTAMTSEVHGYLVHKLTGEWATSTASADPMGFLDLARMDWSDELLATVGLDRSKLPRLVAPGRRSESCRARRRRNRTASRNAGHRRRRRRPMRRRRCRCLRAGARLCQSRHRRRLRQLCQGPTPMTAPSAR